MEWANEYLDYAKQNFSKKTFDEKRGAFKRLLKSYGDEPVNKINKINVSSFLRNEFKARSGNAANKDRKNLITAWNFGCDYMQGFPNSDSNPFHDVPRFSEKRSPRYIPPEEDFWKIYNVAEGQDKIMLLTFLYLGARRKEVFNLKWSDIDFENNKVRLWTQKRQGGTLESDLLPMVSDLAAMLKNWKKDRPVKQTDYVFVCLETTAFTEKYYGQPFQYRQHFMKKLCGKAGVEPFGFHAVRHLSASILYHKGLKVSAIQAVLRHKSPTTTDRYLKSLGTEFVRGELEEAFCGLNNKTGETDQSRHLKVV